MKKAHDIDVPTNMFDEDTTLMNLDSYLSVQEKAELGKTFQKLKTLVEKIEKHDEKWSSRPMERVMRGFT